MLQGCGLPELKRLIRNEQRQKRRGIVMTSKQVISNADSPPVRRAPGDKIYHSSLICFKAIKMVLMFSSIHSLFNALASGMMAGVSLAKIHTEQVAQWSNCPRTLHHSVKGFPFPINNSFRKINTVWNIFLFPLYCIYQKKTCLCLIETGKP